MQNHFQIFARKPGCGEGNKIDEHAGQMMMRYQGVGQTETGGPAVASPVFQPLPVFADDIIYIHDIRLHVYIYIYIHTYMHIIYIYI